MKLPPKKRPGNPVLASDWNTLVDALAARTPRPSAGSQLVFTSGGFFYRFTQTASATAMSSKCPFGQIITWTEGEGETAVTKTGIRGGVVYAGDKVWNVTPQEINLSVAGSWLVWLSIGVTANHADGVLLPGLETSDEPAWDKIASGSGGYPDQDIPTTETGTAIIALGTLTVADRAAAFDPAGCGNIQLAHCPGTLTHTRV